MVDLQDTVQKEYLKMPKNEFWRQEKRVSNIE